MFLAGVSIRYAFSRLAARRLDNQLRRPLHRKNGKDVVVGSEDSLQDALYLNPTLRAELENEVRLAIVAENRRDGKKLTHIDQAHQPDDLPEIVEDLMDEPLSEEELFGSLPDYDEEVPA